MSHHRLPLIVILSSLGLLAGCAEVPASPGAATPHPMVNFGIEGRSATSFEERAVRFGFVWVPREQAFPARLVSGQWDRHERHCRGCSPQ